MVLNDPEHLLDIQQKLISMIALGRPMIECLERIALEVESMIPVDDVYCSILLLENDELRRGAAPNISEAYTEAIHGLKIGPTVGSCGTAAYTGQTVISADIESDPKWADYLEVSRPAGLFACWSVPIRASHGGIIGTFGLYFGHKQEADPEQLKLLNRLSALAGIVIEREHNERQAREMHRTLQLNTHRFESFAQAMPDLVLVLDEQGHYVDVYGIEVESLIMPVEMIKGKNLSDVLPPAKSEAMMSVIQTCLQTQQRQVFEYALDVQTGQRIFEARVSPIKHYNPENPILGHVVWVAQDISERKQADDTIRKLSFYDAVTSLPNRSLLEERLSLQIRKCVKKQTFGAILYLDLNDFKRVNELVGIAGGDAVIIDIATKIADLLDNRDSLARVGGDDFVVLLDSTNTNLDVFSSEISSIATRILTIFDERFHVDEHWFRLVARIGISTFGSEYCTAEKIINQAEAAMYRAKDSNQNIVFFDGKIQQALHDRIQMEYDLEHAIHNGEICAYFQPQVSPDGHVLGFEALMRWEHPDKGFISPLDFIPLAEELGIILQLQDVVLRDVCKLILNLEANSKISPDFRVAVNISAYQFTKDDFEGALLKVVNEFGVSPKRITLEITEGTLLEDIDAATAQMQHLRKIGFEVSIDDFGTGYSSLAYLQRLPADEIKIDKSFIDEMEASEAGKNIVLAIVYLGRQLNCRLVAEGVERASQLEMLRDQSVEMIQGYYFAKPMSAEQLYTWIDALDSDAQLLAPKSA